MVDILKASEIYLDNEESDDGYYSAGFLIDKKEAGAPNNVGFCRDEVEDPGWIYVEADDQIYGFKTKRIKFSFEDSVLIVELLDGNKFYWNNGKILKILIPDSRIKEVADCLSCIFELNE